VRVELTLGYRVEGIGTLWSLYREQNNMHRAVVAASLKGDRRLADLPTPFETIIPNATKIAETTDAAAGKPASFAAKYTTPFARLFESLCDEITQRTEWSPPERAEAAVARVGR
jgi:chromosome partitioning protein